MPRPCGPCQEKRRNEMDKRLLEMDISGETFRGISREFCYSEDALSRHKANHLSKDVGDVHLAMMNAREQALQAIREKELEDIKVEAVEGMAAKLENAASVLAQLREVRSKAGSLLDQAEAVHDLRAAGTFLKELREQIRLMAELEGRLAIKNQVAVGVALNPTLVQKESDWIARSQEIEEACMSDFLRKYVVRIPDGHV
jgi:hypothetical protein